jgi:hypothetical protein
MKWKIVRWWLRKIRGMNRSQIDSYLALKQFQKYPERWDRKPLPNKGVFLEPREEEKERWFREEMLHRPGNNGT